MSNADLEYKHILEDRMKNINDKIKDLEKRAGKFYDVGSVFSTRLAGLREEYKKLQAQVEDYENRESMVSFLEGGVSFLDDKYDNNSDKIEAIQDEINELNRIKSGLLSKRAENKALRMIARREKKIKRLKKKGAFIGKVQRTIMFPKYRLDIKRNNLIAHAEGRVKNYEDKIHDNIELQNMLSSSDSLKSTVLGSISNMRGAYYERRLERSKSILDEIRTKNHIVTMYGARPLSLGKNTVSSFRNMNNPTVSNPVPTR